MGEEGKRGSSSRSLHARNHIPSPLQHFLLLCQYQPTSPVMRFLSFICLQRYLRILIKSSIPVMGKMACTRRKQYIVSPGSYGELLWKRGLELVALVSYGAALITLESVSFQNRFLNSNDSLLWLKYDSGTTDNNKMIMGIIYPKRQKLKSCYHQQRH